MKKVLVASFILLATLSLLVAGCAPAPAPPPPVTPTVTVTATPATVTTTATTTLPPATITATPAPAPTVTRTLTATPAIVTVTATPPPAPTVTRTLTVTATVTAPPSQPVTTEKLRILSHGMRMGFGWVYVDGTAKNISSSRLSSAQVDVKFYDAAGILLRILSASIFGLDPGEVWGFEVSAQDSAEQIASYKVQVNSTWTR